MFIQILIYSSYISIPFARLHREASVTSTKKDVSVATGAGPSPAAAVVPRRSSEQVEWLSSVTQTTSGLWALETRGATQYRGGEPAVPCGDAKHVESPGARGQSVSTDGQAGGAWPLSGFQTNRLEERLLAGSISSFYRWLSRRYRPWRHYDSPQLLAFTCWLAANQLPCFLIESSVLRWHIIM